MPWLLVPPGHQEQWYWNCAMWVFLPSLGMDLNTLLHCWDMTWNIYIYFSFPSKICAWKVLRKSRLWQLGCQPIIKTNKTYIQKHHSLCGTDAITYHTGVIDAFANQLFIQMSLMPSHHIHVVNAIPPYTDAINVIPPYTDVINPHPTLYRCH